MKNNFFQIAGFLIIFMLVLISCNKESQSCAEIIVKDELGNPRAGASIRLHQDKVQNDPNATRKPDPDLLANGKGTTDASGKASFCYEHEAIWELEVILSGYQTAEDYVRLEKEETVTKIVVLKK